MTRIHFIGVGGIGMSGVARLFAARGASVSGSDRADSPLLDRLRDEGIDVHIGHDADAVVDVDAVVLSTAIAEDNPELVAARAAGARVLHRSEAIAELVRDLNVVAVSGTHGKTTTSALVATALGAAERSAGYLVGGVLGESGSNAALLDGDLFTVEADESDGSFLNYPANIRVITNIDRDHLDHHGGFDGVKAAFRSFATRDAGGHTLVACGDDPNVREVLAGVDVVTYGFDRSNDSHMSRFRADDGRVSFDLSIGGAERGRFDVPLLGRHNALNAAAAITVAHLVGADLDLVRDALAAFRGVGRRFTIVGESTELVVAHDYAHHPTEIRATLSAVKEGYERRLVVVFQPHRFTRTRDHLDEFAEAFGDADVLFVTPIYAASEAPIAGVTGETLADRARAHHADVRFVDGDVVESVGDELRPGDVVVFVGAGDVYRGAETLAAARARSRPD